MSEKQLTVKQRAFISFYCLVFNATEAARCAKYQGNDNVLAGIGYENLRKPNIRQEIEERLKTHVMGESEALAHLANIARDYEHPGQLKALELVAKHLKLFEERHHVRMETLNIDFNQLSDNQLRRLANGEDYRSILGDKS